MIGEVGGLLIVTTIALCVVSPFAALWMLQRSLHRNSPNPQNLWRKN